MKIAKKTHPQLDPAERLRRTRYCFATNQHYIKLLLYEQTQSLQASLLLMAPHAVGDWSRLDAPAQWQPQAADPGPIPFAPP